MPNTPSWLEETGSVLKKVTVPAMVALSAAVGLGLCAMIVDASSAGPEAHGYDDIVELCREKIGGTVGCDVDLGMGEPSISEKSFVRVSCPPTGAKSILLDQVFGDPDDAKKAFCKYEPPFKGKFQ